MLDATDGTDADVSHDPCRTAPAESLRRWNLPPGSGTAGLVNVRVEGDAVWGPLPPADGPESTAEVPFDPWSFGPAHLMRIIGLGEGEVFVPAGDAWLTRVDVDVWSYGETELPACELVLAVHDLGESGHLVVPSRATVGLPCSSLPSYDGIRSPDVASSFVLEEPIWLPGGRPAVLLLLTQGDTVAGIRKDDPLAEGSYFIEGEPWPRLDEVADWDLAFTAFLTRPSGPWTTGTATMPAAIPDELGRWHSLEWTTRGPPGRIRAVLLWQPTVGFVPVPDELFPGNAAGFTVSPLDLCGLNPARVPSLMVQMVFEPGADGLEAGLSSWELRWVVP